MEKKNYEGLKIDVVTFNAEDIITTSQAEVCEDYYYYYDNECGTVM